MPGAHLLRSTNRTIRDEAKRLEVIGNNGVGYDKIDVARATEKGVLVVNTPTAVTNPTAELTIALMLAVMRAIPAKDRELRKSLEAKPVPVPRFASTAYGKTLGIIGFGRVGRRVAELAVALGMNIVYSDPTRASESAEAALDLFESEPTVHKDLVTLENVVVSPHMGTMTYESRIEMMSEALRGIVNCLEGRLPANSVNPEAVPA